ncbi:hypothetical protein Tco_1296163, partial [Tanacetum coccineum]
MSMPPTRLMARLENKILMEERNYKREELMHESHESVPKLNCQQRKIYDLIIQAYATKQQELIFVYGLRRTEKSSGSTTSHSDHSLSEYESFCFDVDHIEKKSSGSTISHSDLSILEYESFHFDLSIDLLPPADRSDFHLEEFADELAHIISPPEYDRFYFDLEDISSLDPPESTLVIDESTLLVTPLPDSKEIFLREV